MHFGNKLKLISTVLLAIGFMVAALPVQAATVDQVINEYSRLTTLSANNRYASDIKALAAQLVAENKHHDYPGVFLAEDVNKWMFYKGMEVTTLAEILPTLPEPTATSLKAYLKYEVTNYLLNKTFTDFEKQGSLNTKISYVNWSSTWWQWRSVEYEGVYGLWAYAQYTNDWDTIKQNWTKVKALFDSGSGISKTAKKWMGYYFYAPNDEIAGRIAYARMAKKLYNLTGDSSYQTIYQGQTSQISSLLNGLGSYVSRGIYQNQICDFDATKTCVKGVDNSGRQMLPYLSQFDFLTPELARWYKDNYSTQANTVVTDAITQFPFWYWGSYDVLRTDGAGEEGYFQSPLFSYQLYQTKALVLNDSVANLQKYLPLRTETATVPVQWDILSYGNNLALVSRMETTAWTDTNTAPTSLASGTAPQCPSDVNLDGFTDLEDYSIMSSNFLMPPSTNLRADIDQNGFVDLTDYSLLSGKFLMSCNQ